jgi:FkbM family methyltransferase
VKDEIIISYAQNREDVLLDAFFGDKYKGFYVDVGASDPEKFSVTKLFYDRGWSGINIEPNETLVKKLKRLRTRDTTISAAVGDKPGTAPFRQYVADGLSTLSKKTKNRLEGKDFAADYSDIQVDVVTLADVFKQHANNKTIDFMKVDVEGYEYEVLNSNDWSKYRPQVLCIEADKIERDWSALLKTNHYKRVFNDGLNDYYADEKNSPQFDYLHRVIGRTIYPAHAAKVLERVDYLEQQGQILEAEVRRLRKVVSNKDEEIQFLHLHVAELNRFKNMVKNLAVKVHTIIDLRLSEQFKRKKLYPKMSLNVETASKEELLAEIQRADHDVFYRRPSSLEYAKIHSAKGLHRVYKLSAKAAKKSAKAAKRTLKKVRG